jgi:hypothetical protein
MAHRVFYKNAASLLVCTSSLILASFQQYHSVGSIVGLYVAGDLFFTKEPDIMAHHVLAGLFIVSVRTLDPANYLLESQAIVNMEISTLFLVFNNLMKEKILVVPAAIYKINQYLFLLTFTKYRIWDYYWVLIHQGSFPTALTMTAIWGLFLLDLYWFSLLIRKVNKSLHISDPVHSIRRTEVCDPCFLGRNAS